MRRIFIIALCLFLNIIPVLAEQDDTKIKETYKLEGQIEYDDSPVDVIYLDE